LIFKRLLQKHFCETRLSCSNNGLKAYLLVLASSGLRAVEAASIRPRDIDFSSNPVKIHIRKEYSKTRIGRDTYISDKTVIFLKQWVHWKYRKKDINATAKTNSNETINGKHLELQDLVEHFDPNDLLFKHLQY